MPSALQTTALIGLILVVILLLVFFLAFKGSTVSDTQTQLYASSPKPLPAADQAESADELTDDYLSLEEDQAPSCAEECTTMCNTLTEQPEFAAGVTPTTTHQEAVALATTQCAECREACGDVEVDPPPVGQ